MAGDPNVLLRFVQAQAAQRARSTSTAQAGATRAFAKLDRDDWWNPSKTKAATKQALKVVQPAQRQAARSAASFLARAATEMTGKTVRPAGAVDITKLRKAMPADVARAIVEGRLDPAFVVLGDLHNGPGDDIDTPVTLAVPDPNESVIDRLRRQRAERDAAKAEPLDPGIPYGRAADLFRREIAEGKTEDQARDKALLRIATVAETDVMLAVREQWRASGKNIPGIRGYRRILHPEQSKTGPCGLCVVAADRIYRVAELAAIHDLCCCEVLPIIGEQDPGIELNAADLRAIYEAAGGTGGEKTVVVDGVRKHVSPGLKKIRVALAEHGELGPVLVDASQHFRGPREVAETELRRVAA